MSTSSGLGISCERIGGAGTVIRYTTGMTTRSVREVKAGRVVR